MDFPPKYPQFMPHILFVVGLLGDKKRRGRDERYINLFVDRAIKTALIASAPTILPVDERT